MRIYTVHVRPVPGGIDDDVVLVKEGFSWPAFFLSVLWAAWQRLWLVALVMLALELSWSLLADWLLLPAALEAIVALLLAAGLGIVGNDLRRHGLFGRGYREAAVVAGRDADEAVLRFFDQGTASPTGFPR